MVKLEPLVSVDQKRLLIPGLLTLDRYYPDIEKWFTGKVLNNASTDNIAIGAFENNALVGFVLGKRGVESKLRCVRVEAEYQGSGLGLRLIEAGMETLGDAKPLVTVSEELLGLYSRAFVNRYGYSLDAVVKHAYRRGKLEYVFNGELI